MTLKCNQQVAAGGRYAAAVQFAAPSSYRKLHAAATQADDAHQRGASEYGGGEDDPVVQLSCGDSGRASALLTMTRKPSGGARPPASGHPPPPDADHRPRVDILPPGVMESSPLCAS
ncbi:hypothetical protein FQA47_017999 [Oryzias melastigma]|uniref:Uncharacterized protein n=1 Tax=Oryzias melastigma TaxID=30732 RepID=A0A834F4K9_ORYME|nr:hypothetical protein FQA47_017999 [Oryzias melastigma]